MDTDCAKRGAIRDAGVDASAADLGKLSKETRTRAHAGLKKRAAASNPKSVEAVHVDVEAGARRGRPSRGGRRGGARRGGESQLHGVALADVADNQGFSLSGVRCRGKIRRES